MSLRLPPELYASLCRDILGRDGWKCRNCGSRNNLNVHHIIFRSQQGPDESWNLCVLCNYCHDGIHTDVDEHGEPGLVIQLPANADAKLLFIWTEGWHPGP